MQPGPSRSAKELVQPAVQANKEHQYALKVYTERLEAELEHLDKLLTLAEASEDEDDELTSGGGNVIIPGAKKPRGLIPQNYLVEESSPFYHDALRKQRYEEFTTVHPMKAQELEALADAVRSENYRLYALQAQAQGLPTFTGLVDPPPGFINNNKHGIDWERVAQKVTSASTTVHRTAKECEIRWLGERHPEFNDAQWTPSEIAKVRELVDGAREGEVDWVDVAQKLGTGRTPVDCMRHAVVRKAHSWTPEADRRLLEAVGIYGTDNWSLAARWVSEDATTAQCQNRYTRTLDPTLKRGPWTPDEDERLKEAVSVIGHSWIDVAAYVEGRNNEQCRDRYQEYLNPSVSKGKWTEEQDAALLKAVEQVGLGKWKEVSQLANVGRTDNMCRVRYTALTRSARSRKTASPAPGGSQTPSEQPSQGTSQGPSGAGTNQPTGQSTPTGKAPPPILILHPESYVPGTSGSAPTQQPKPKPKPRPRKKKATTADDEPAPSPVREYPSEAVQEGIAQDTPLSNDTAIAPPLATEEHPAQVGSKRSIPDDGSGSQPSKKRRTEGSVADNPPPPPSDTSSSTVDASTAGVVEEAPQDDISASAGGRGMRGRGRGRGGTRARGRGRGRGRSRGGSYTKTPLQSAEGQDALDENMSEAHAPISDTVQREDPVSEAQTTAPPSTPSRPSKAGNSAVTPAPTRRQPPRTANKSSRPSTSVAGSS
ncbi:hypothetical protein C8Q70DRAFT_493312 [Cubamyces menziesii]|uniref:snRNA-activating protein complex subunit 4 n=1 Tax=Trametes cubensis TaxID=1111947 RepID=A0AAD7TWS6_9APHY|nr:hypothetical protein C8Q70DRAFT_493312 [Cubamyces menziesii]KAJ8487478.1 hypothetical protein ONZ51_g4142 [Trametes cubensis]